MSDDLVKRLREGDEFEQSMLAERAADRIEELEAKLAKNEALMQVGFAEYERRLAKAVEFVECAINYAKTCGARFPVDHARTTLAELKGEKDE